MNRSGRLFVLVFIVVAAIVMALNARLGSHRTPRRGATALPESFPVAPDLDSLPGDSLYYGELRRHRQELDQVFRGDESPLEESDRVQFTGLRYFPIDPSYRLEVELKPPPRREIVVFLDTKGAERKYERYGLLDFSLQGQRQHLTLFRDPGRGYFFLPFLDATSGGETYGAGRYLEPQEQEPGRFVIDFNRAYNPYCAYSARWSCPVPPPENRLEVAVRAGEMKFHHDS